MEFCLEGKGEVIHLFVYSFDSTRLWSRCLSGNEADVVPACILLTLCREEME